VKLNLANAGSTRRAYASWSIGKCRAVVIALGVSIPHRRLSRNGTATFSGRIVLIVRRSGSLGGRIVSGFCFNSTRRTCGTTGRIGIAFPFAGRVGRCRRLKTLPTLKAATGGHYQERAKQKQGSKSHRVKNTERRLFQGDFLHRSTTRKPRLVVNESLLGGDGHLGSARFEGDTIGSNGLDRYRRGFGQKYCP